MSYFGEFDPAGRAREDLPSGWEEARKVTSILVDAITPKDHYTSDHALEVARLSWLVGMELGLNEEELEWLVHGALLHDLGKLSVADEILEKLGHLTEEEGRSCEVRAFESLIEANFSEPRKAEVQVLRIYLPRTPVNRASASLYVRLSTPSRGATIKRRAPAA